MRQGDAEYKAKLRRWRILMLVANKSAAEMDEMRQLDLELAVAEMAATGTR